MSILTAFLAGLLFAAGLVISGMVMPSKVMGFLDVAGDWDPSLAFVMGAALLVYAPLFRLIVRLKGPVLANTFSLPSFQHLDARLIGGAAVFGVGWGLSGMCPGPAIVVAGAQTPAAIVFVLAMVLGAGGFRWLDGRRQRRSKHGLTLQPDT